MYVLSNFTNFERKNLIFPYLAVNVKTFISFAVGRVRKCILKFNFLDRDLYRDEYCVKPKHIRGYVEKKFFKLMFKAIEKSSETEPNM